MKRCILAKISVAALAMTLASCDARPGQQRGDIEAGQCSECTIRLTRLATLGDTLAPTPHDWYRVARDQRGRYYVAPLFRATAEIAVFDSTGHSLGTLGRRGGGPSEFSFVRFVVPDANDSLFVFDIGHRRLTVLDSAYQFARSASLPTRTLEDLVANGTDHFVLHAYLDRSPGAAPLHRLSRDGVALQSFGAPTDRPDTALMDRLRVLAPAESARLWSARVNRYEIERWDSGGRLEITLVGERPWFEPWTQQNAAPADAVRPLPRLQGMSEDEEGRLWVFVWVPELDWQSARKVSRRDRREEVPQLVAPLLSQYQDTMVEVWDVQQSTVIVSARLDTLVRPLGPGLVYGDVEDLQGNHRIAIWRLHLTDQSAGNPR